MLAGGGEAWADIEYLRAEEGLFGDVASAPTLYRTVRALDPAVPRCYPLHPTSPIGLVPTHSCVTPP